MRVTAQLIDAATGGQVWSRPTIFGHGVPMAFPGTPDIGAGLTDRGKDLVRLCNTSGILIHLSHMNRAGSDDMAALSSAPPVARLAPRVDERGLHQLRAADLSGICNAEYTHYVWSRQYQSG